MKTFSEIINDLAEDLNIDKDDSTNLSNLKRWINDAYKDFNNKYPWRWKRKWGVFLTELLYDTGTASATNGSRTITGSGTNWTSSMVGRYFKIDSDNEKYKIIAVNSTTSLTIDVPYVQDSVSGKSYKIFPANYDLNTDVEEILEVYIDTGIKRIPLDPFRDAPWVFKADLNQTPTKYAEDEPDRKVSTYTTGTVSGTVDTNTLTGSGTSWLDNARPGDEVVIGSYTYNILSVDSDTQLTLVQKLMTTVSGSSYTIRREKIKRITLNGTPKDHKNVVRYLYHQKTYNLLNDNDILEIPEKYIPVMLIKAKSLAYAYLDDTRENSELNKYEALAKKTWDMEKAKDPKPKTFLWKTELNEWAL